MTEIKPDVSQAIPLHEADYDLIPLNRWNWKAKDKAGNIRDLGKVPVQKDWTNRPCDNAATLSRMGRGEGNTGVRLGAKDLVIDYDPRHDSGRWGVSDYVEFILQNGLDPTDWPTVRTGSGGLHHYLKKPVDLSVVDHLKDFPGIEFKSRGRQVVAPGSIHPEGKMYRWIEFPEDLWLDGAPMAPQSLLDAAQRPLKKETSGSNSGLHTANEVAEMLGALDPEAFRDYSEWLKIMMACHHATGGRGRDEFIAWSTSDPIYEGHEAEIGGHWDSLDTEKVDGITYLTLYKALCEIGRADVIPRTDPSSDFEEVEDASDWKENSSGPSPRLAIRVGRGRLTDNVDLGIRALRRELSDIVLQRGGYVVRPLRLDEAVDGPVRHTRGALILTEVNEHWLTYQLAKSADWFQQERGGKTRQADPPIKVARTILALSGDWPFDVVKTVASCPIVNASTGVVSDRPGMNAASGVLCSFKDGDFEPIRNDLDRDAATELMSRVMDELFGLFPFNGEASRAVAASALLCAISRPTMATCPAHAFDAAAAGTGKSKMVDTVAVIATGVKASAQTWAHNEDENEKRIGAFLLSAAPIFMVDNMDAKRGDVLCGTTFCSMLTHETVSVRVLGQSTKRELPTRTLVMPTGNNLEVKGDACRRVIKCRLDAKMEHPETRSFEFDPVKRAAERRGRIVSDLCSVLASYIKAGRPTDPVPLGSFEDWTAVRGALVWCGFEDPAMTIAEVKAGDRERDDELEALELIHQITKGEWTTVRTLLEEVRHLLDSESSDTSAFEALVGYNLDSPKKASTALRSMADVVRGPFQFQVNSTGRIKKIRVVKSD